MNKAQIKAELRRSACEDKRPFFTIDVLAFQEASNWRCGGEWIADFCDDDCRTFFLFVAEAL